MTYKCVYKTPQGFTDMIMSSDGERLTGLKFEAEEDISEPAIYCSERELEIFGECGEWLNIYFSGRVPDFTPEYKLENLTPFRKEVLDIVSSIAYGKTLAYGDISKIIAESRGIKRMSAQAVGGAVGWNPVCIIIPCHRVVGAHGSLTGYGGGINNKAALLSLEGIDIAQ